MEQTKEITYWETDYEKEIPLSPWMLVDWHAEGRIDAGAGLAPMYALGERIAPRLLERRGLGEWMRRQLSDNLNLVWLIPLEGIRWFVFPNLYLSTGYLLLVRAPMPNKYVAALAAGGVLGEIAVFPGRLAEIDPTQTRMLTRRCQELLKAVSACMPQPCATATELYRILHAVAAWTNVHLSRTVTVGRFTERCDEELCAEVDLGLFTAMMWMLLSAISQCRSGPLALVPEEGEEGLLFSFQISSLRDGALLKHAHELITCRELAERNCLLFHSEVQGKQFRGQLCVTRKDFALLGIKVEEHVYDD